MRHESSRAPIDAVFVGDGGPDAAEFANNYFPYDPEEPSERPSALEAANLVWLMRKSKVASLPPPKFVQVNLPLE